MMLATLDIDMEAALAAERPRLVRLAQRVLWDEEEAADVVQAASVQALARASTLPPGTDCAAWLTRVVVNQAIGVLRRRRVWQALGRLVGVSPEPVALPEEEAARRRHLRRLGEAVSRLSARQAAAFSLRYLEGQSIDEVAQALDIDRGTVRVHLQRAVKALRDAGALEEGGRP